MSRLLVHGFGIRFVNLLRDFSYQTKDSSNEKCSQTCHKTRTTKKRQSHEIGATDNFLTTLSPTLCKMRLSNGSARTIRTRIVSGHEPALSNLWTLHLHRAPRHSIIEATERHHSRINQTTSGKLVQPGHRAGRIGLPRFGSYAEGHHTRLIQPCHNLAASLFIATQSKMALNKVR